MDHTPVVNVSEGFEQLSKQLAALCGLLPQLTTVDLLSKGREAVLHLDEHPATQLGARGGLGDDASTAAACARCLATHGTPSRGVPVTSQCIASSGDAKGRIAVHGDFAVSAEHIRAVGADTTVFTAGRRRGPVTVASAFIAGAVAAIVLLVTFTFTITAGGRAVIVKAAAFHRLRRHGAAWRPGRRTDLGLIVVPHLFAIAVAVGSVFAVLKNVVEVAAHHEVVIVFPSEVGVGEVRRRPSTSQKCSFDGGGGDRGRTRLAAPHAKGAAGVVAVLIGLLRVLLRLLHPGCVVAHDVLVQQAGDRCHLTANLCLAHGCIFCGVQVDLFDGIDAPVELVAHLPHLS
mmetsp:Transcript_19112/g.33019  ORF Transcript_19112/g.33019 Transcript_19112/m.33019 type:complete len:345 (-) Transcript_19112:1124-2158(-)